MKRVFFLSFAAATILAGCKEEKEISQTEEASNDKDFDPNSDQATYLQKLWLRTLCTLSISGFIIPCGRWLSSLKRSTLYKRNPGKGSYNTNIDHLSCTHKGYTSWSPDYFKNKAAPHGAHVMSYVEKILAASDYPETG